MNIISTLFTQNTMLTDNTLYIDTEVVKAVNNVCKLLAEYVRVRCMKLDLEVVRLGHKNDKPFIIGRHLPLFF